MQSIDALSDALAEARAATLFRVLPAGHWPAVAMQSSLHGMIGSVLIDINRRNGDRHASIKHSTSATCSCDWSEYLKAPT